MSALSELKEAKTIHDVAALLGYKASAVSYIIYKQSESEKYKSFSIPKKAGGERLIDMPLPKLMQLQRRLSELLQRCYSEIQTAPRRTDRNSGSVAHGFVKERSIITNAHAHRHRKYVFNVDLHDFFGSINFGRVRGYFISDKRFQLESKVATILAQIACYNNRLPQGSPCSPVISNLIGHILDVHLVRLAQKHRVHYTRYADDLTFSTNLPTFPDAVAVHLPGGDWQVGAELAHLLKISGFSINPSKTRMQYCTSRQEVTGLVVNKKVNVISDYHRKVRAMVHKLVTTGQFDLDGSPGIIEGLHGMLGFIHHVDNYKSKKKEKPPKEEETSLEKTYRKFLLYKEFFASPKPVIICEGKTDNIYLKLAINALAQKFPALASIDAEGKITRKVRIYRYTETSTGKILKIFSGGTPSLAGLIKTYIDEIKIKKFKPPSKQYPFIFLVDNDDGIKNILRAIKYIQHPKSFDFEIARKQPHTHVSHNLFIVPTPLSSNKPDSKIEDFFDDTITKTVRNGKKFSLENNKSDRDTYYGKKIFAEEVVLKNASTINFDGFSQILKNISEIIDSYT